MVLLVLKFTHLWVVVVRHVQPGVFKHLLCARAVTRMPLQDWHEEVRKHLGFVLFKPVLLHQQSIQREVPEPIDVLEDVLATQ